MASLGNLGSTGSLRIEVEGTGGGGDYSSSFAQAVQSIASAVAGVVSQLPEESRPKEITLTCGLKAVAGGGFAVSLGTETSNFTLSLAWKSDSEGGALGGMMPVPDAGPRV
jgi:hypothetical protein